MVTALHRARKWANGDGPAPVADRRAGAGLLFKAALSVAITTAEPGSTAGVLAMFFVVAYLGIGLPPVLFTAATHLISSGSALIVFSAVILAVSVIAARLQAAALRH